ncbi:MAG TPA: NapC/NirT family cytochrome c, partial [Verrucomicrobiae bacterium]|nr:NapC/NirT family cytochrome c [Verrucomicrobiae bacterium]
MEETPANPVPTRRSSVFRNWLSLSGLVVMVGSLFSFVLLLMMDAMAHLSNPYLGILTYLVAPAFMVMGLVTAVGGALLRRRHMVKASGPFPPLRIDLTRPRDRRFFGLFLAGSVVFLLISAVGSYQSYHYTESVQFCGQACHGVMKPEFVTYSHSSHARVACAECHIGKGAAWYVRSKLSGTYQVYATMAEKYPKPIPTPVKNLRPAQETCEECHWPKKFVGNVERSYTSFLGDETNTPFTVRLLLKVGGGDPTHGPVGGIHWHMNVGNRIDYVAADEGRQKIPWVRMVDAQGVVTEFRSPKFTNQVDEASVRRMDCMDCHNRP